MVGPNQNNQNCSQDDREKKEIQREIELLNEAEICPVPQKYKYEQSQRHKKEKNNTSESDLPSFTQLRYQEVKAKRKSSKNTSKDRSVSIKTERSSNNLSVSKLNNTKKLTSIDFHADHLITRRISKKNSTKEGITKKLANYYDYEVNVNPSDKSKRDKSQYNILNMGSQSGTKFINNLKIKHTEDKKKSISDSSYGLKNVSTNFKNTTNLTVSNKSKVTESSPIQSKNIQAENKYDNYGTYKSTKYTTENLFSPKLTTCNGIDNLNKKHIPESVRTSGKPYNNLPESQSRSAVSKKRK